MKAYKLKIPYLQFVDTLIDRGGKVIAPLAQPDKQAAAPSETLYPLRFGVIRSSAETIEPDLYISTVRSAKEFLFPQSEPVAEYRYDNKDLSVSDPILSFDEQIIIGLRPCDASAFSIIDDIFSYKFRDEFYLQRREKTTMISVACEKTDEACFCNSAGLSNTSEAGSDIMLIIAKDGNIQALSDTKRGQTLLDGLAGIAAEIPEPEEYSQVYSEAFNSLRSALDKDLVKVSLDNNFDNPLWETISLQCLGCASCAYLCPTCHCFDIIDENRYQKGLRRKNWDACQFPAFTLHASGHNPRDNQSKRYRQRIMHKFSYYEDRFNRMLCTGCGRCIRSCPVNIDIYSIAKQISELAPNIAEEN